MNNIINFKKFIESEGNVNPLILLEDIHDFIYFDPEEFADLFKRIFKMVCSYNEDPDRCNKLFDLYDIKQDISADNVMTFSFKYSENFVAPVELKDSDDEIYYLYMSGALDVFLDLRKIYKNFFVEGDLAYSGAPVTIYEDSNYYKIKTVQDVVDHLYDMLVKIDKKLYVNDE